MKLVLGSSLVIAVVAFWKHRRLSLLFLLLWACVPYMIFSLAKTKMGSYCAIAIPAICLLIGYALALLAPVVLTVLKKILGV